MKHKVIRIGMLLLAGLLAGCQTMLPVDERDNTTGQLGTEEKAESAANPFVALAAEYLRLGNYSAALNYGTKGVKADPDNTNAQVVLALVYQALEENALAEKHFREALDIDPKDPYALNAFGDMLCEQGRYDEGLAHLNKAVENPLYERPYVAMGNAGKCAAAKGSKQEAETYYRNSLNSNEYYLPSLAGMASISYEGGHYMSARAYVERYRAITIPSAEVLWVGIQTERKLQNRDQAKSYELLLRSEYPDSDEVRQLNNEM